MAIEWCTYRCGCKRCTVMVMKRIVNLFVSVAGNCSQLFSMSIVCTTENLMILVLWYWRKRIYRTMHFFFSSFSLPNRKRTGLFFFSSSAKFKQFFFGLYPFFFSHSFFSLLITCARIANTTTVYAYNHI